MVLVLLFGEFSEHVDFIIRWLAATSQRSDAHSFHNYGLARSGGPAVWPSGLVGFFSSFPHTLERFIFKGPGGLFFIDFYSNFIIKT